MLNRLLPALAGILLSVTSTAQTIVTVPAHTVTVPVPAVTPPPVTPPAVVPPPVVLSALGQTLSLQPPAVQPPAVQPPAIAATTITYQEPAYTITVAATPPAPTATLSALPASIQAGAASTLTWASTNATACTGTGTTPAGTLSVKPAATTSYGVTCTGLGGSATASATVTVTTPAPPAAQMIGTLAVGSLTSITDASGNVWTVPGGVVQSNGTAVGVSSGVILLVMDAKGTFWQENASCLWWSWSGTTWGTTGSTTGPAGVTLPTCTTTPPPVVVTPPPVVVTPPAALTSVFSYPNGFASAAGAFKFVSNAALVGSDLLPVNCPAGHCGGAIWPANQVSIAKGFTTDFYFKISPVAGSLTAPAIAGFALVIQNSNRVGSTCPGLQYSGTGSSADANMLGFGQYNLASQCGILNSVAVAFDADPSNGQYATQAFQSNATAIAGTGLFLNGGPWAALRPGLDMAGSGINFYSQHLFHATVTYDGKILVLNLLDTVTQAQYLTSWAVNIAQVIQGTSAWIGITAGDGIGVTSATHITAWNLSTGDVTPPPAAPVAGTSINLPNGFAAGGIVPNGSAKLIGTTLQLTDTAMSQEAGAGWSPVPMPIKTFHTSFLYQATAGAGGSANGAAFVIQSCPATTPTGDYQWIACGPNALANASGGLGFSGLTNGTGGQISCLTPAVAVKLDLYTGGGNQTGLYQNCADPTQNNVPITGVKLTSGDPILATLAYDGKTLGLTLLDTKTNSTFSYSWQIDIPTALGGSTAWVGFTGSTGGINSTQTIQSWTYMN